MNRACESACIDLLTALLSPEGGPPRGVALFMLDCGCAQCGPTALPDDLLADIARRLRVAAPAWHRLIRREGQGYVVITQGLVDGSAVLATAARLVHAFDDAIQVADLPSRPEVSIGIAVSPQQGARPQELLAACEASLRQSMSETRCQTCLA